MGSHGASSAAEDHPAPLQGWATNRQVLVLTPAQPACRPGGPPAHAAPAGAAKLGPVQHCSRPPRGTTGSVWLCVAVVAASRACLAWGTWSRWHGSKPSFPRGSRAQAVCPRSGAGKDGRLPRLCRRPGTPLCRGRDGDGLRRKHMH